MFRHLLSAAVIAAGIGFVGTADTAQARDHHHHFRGNVFRGHGNGHFHGGRRLFHTRRLPFLGRSIYRGGYYGGSGGYYSSPYGYGNGYGYGGRGFSLNIW
jgi:hypothetical protein